MLPSAQVPITVSLTHSTVNLLQDGTAVIDPITIASSSETALVVVSGLPAGVQVNYASTDTNPSGTLTFVAGADCKLVHLRPPCLCIRQGKRHQPRLP